jgi:hypothetical protein
MAQSVRSTGDWNWRQHLLLTLVAVGMLGLGMTGLVGGAAVKISSTVKEHRLDRAGEAVTARIDRYRAGRGRGAASTVWLSYDYRGRNYQAWTECRVDALCRPEKATTLGIKVDPDQPGEFVTATGSTDDSRHWLNSWKMIFLGLLLGLPGAYFTYLGVDTARIELRKRRGVVPPKR